LNNGRDRKSGSYFFGVVLLTLSWFGVTMTGHFGGYLSTDLKAQLQFPESNFDQFISFFVVIVDSHPKLSLFSSTEQVLIRIQRIPLFAQCFFILEQQIPNADATSFLVCIKPWPYITNLPKKHEKHFARLLMYSSRAYLYFVAESSILYGNQPH
jgi:hypothetical protein